MIKMIEPNYEGIAKVLEQMNKLYENGADKDVLNEILKLSFCEGNILADINDLPSESYPDKPFSNGFFNHKSQQSR